MSDQEKSGAQASDKEAVVTEAEDKPEATTEEAAEKVGAEEGAEETEGEEGAEKTEGEETPAETAEETLTKSAKRRERHKAHVAALEAEVARLSEVVAANDRNKPSVAELGPEPDPEKFDSDAKYTAALAAWTVEKTIIARQAKTHDDNTTTARAESAAKKMQLFKERAMALKDGIPDIEKIFSQEFFPVSATLAETIMETDKGPEVAHYLLRHPEDFQRIQNMSQRAAAIEVGRIEAKVSLPKTRKETQAPPPPSTVKGSTTVVTRRTTDASGDALSDEEWTRRERERVAKLRTNVRR